MRKLMSEMTGRSDDERQRRRRGRVKMNEVKGRTRAREQGRKADREIKCKGWEN